LTDQMLGEVRGILGEERWPLLQARLKEKSDRGPYSVGLDSTLNQSGQYLMVWVETDEKGTPTMGLLLQGAVATGKHGALSMFLPEGDPNRTEGAQNTLLGSDYLSNALRQRAVAWLQEQAIARLGKKEKP